MLEHLIGDDLTPLVSETGAQAFVSLDPTPSKPHRKRDRPDAATVLDAQANTANWLTDLGLTENQILPQLQADAAQQAFTAITAGEPSEQQVAALVAMNHPQAVQKVVGMLTAYDWEFVEQAKQLRGYVVTKLIAEVEGASKSGDRIKALQALGKVTEVGLFTEKVEVTNKVEHTDEELDARIKERLAKLRGVMDAIAHKPSPVTDAEPKDV